MEIILWPFANEVYIVWSLNSILPNFYFCSFFLQFSIPNLYLKTGTEKWNFEGILHFPKNFKGLWFHSQSLFKKAISKQEQNNLYAFIDFSPEFPSTISRNLKFPLFSLASKSNYVFKTLIYTKTSAAIFYSPFLIFQLVKVASSTAILNSNCH